MMSIGLITFSTRVDRGFGVRVRSLLSMLASFSAVRVLHIEPETSKPGADRDSILFGLKGVETTYLPCPETARTKVSRLVNYYRKDIPRITKHRLQEIDHSLRAIQVESLNLLFLQKALESGKKKIVLDQHDIRWKLLEYGMYDSPFFRGRIGGAGVVRGTLGPWLLSRARSFESKAIVRSNHVLVTSEVDRQEIVDQIPQAREKITIIPNTVDVRDYKCAEMNPKNSDGVARVVFVGRLEYKPNIDAVRTICTEIAPRFDSGVRFQIVGGPVPILSGYPNNVEFMGIVPDIRPVLEKADVCIAPLRHGSGTRVKIIEYLAMGKAVVSSPIGCEGLDVVDGKNILVAEDPSEQARMINRIIESKSLMTNLGREGRKLVEEKYDWRVYTPTLKSIYESIGAI